MHMAGTARADTRRNILEVSLGLFNERSPAQVTTAEIAASAGVAEGNLHYHFRRKADLLVALFDMFEAEAMTAAVFELDPDDAPLEASVDYQRKWFRLMWAHRWFYRDAASLYSLAPGLRMRVRALTIRAQDLVRSVLKRLIRSGVLSATEDDVEHLLTNIWIISLYWIDYLRCTSGREALREADFEWGYKQVVALYSPFLTAAGKVVFQAALQTDTAVARTGKPEGRKQPGKRA